MRFLGIDYGTRRVGVAISDESGTVAMPLEVIDRTKEDVLERIIQIVAERSANTIILGESKSFTGVDNPIMPEIRKFKASLETHFKEPGIIPVILEPEFLTSQQAEYFQGKHSKLDASAAALILQSYLDRRNSGT